MKYVAVRCEKSCEAVKAVIERLLGIVVFVDVDSMGMAGCAVGKVDTFVCGIGDGEPVCQPWIDLLVASPEKAVKEINKHIGHTAGGMGLGDVVAKITGLLGIKPCASCKKRQEKLNKIMPFR